MARVWWWSAKNSHFCLKLNRHTEAETWRCLKLWTSIHRRRQLVWTVIKLLEVENKAWALLVIWFYSQAVPISTWALSKTPLHREALMSLLSSWDKRINPQWSSTEQNWPILTSKKNVFGKSICNNTSRIINKTWLIKSWKMPAARTKCGISCRNKWTTVNKLLSRSRNLTTKWVKWWLTKLKLWQSKSTTNSNKKRIHCALLNPKTWSTIVKLRGKRKNIAIWNA